MEIFYILAGVFIGFMIYAPKEIKDKYVAWIRTTILRKEN